MVMHSFGKNIISGISTIVVCKLQMRTDLFPDRNRGAKRLSMGGDLRLDQDDVVVTLKNIFAGQQQ